MRAVAIGACLLSALCAGAFSVKTHMDVSLFGFPDGYITDYQKAATTPLKIVMWMQVGFGLLFLALAVPRLRAKARTTAWLCALALFIVVVAAGQFGVPWYYGVHLGLDNGIGG